MMVVSIVVRSRLKVAKVCLVVLILRVLLLGLVLSVPPMRLLTIGGVVDSILVVVPSSFVCSVAVLCR